MSIPPSVESRARSVNFPSRSSGSSSGSSSIPHSFSVDEIQKMRVKLKSSKSYPNEAGRDPMDQKQSANHLTVQSSKNGFAGHEEGDNSSSGVSSDQEVTITHIAQHKTVGILKNANEEKSRDAEPPSPLSSVIPMDTPPQSLKVIDALNKKSMKLPPLSNVTKKILNVSNEPVDKSTQNENDFYDDDAMNSPSPPSKGFQRNNSLTRKQAAAIAMSRALNSRPAVSLVQLPPPIEGDSDTEQVTVLPPQLLGRVPGHHSSRSKQPDHGRTMKTNFVVPPPLAYDKTMADCSPSQENIVLAPPPQFCDCTNANITKIMNSNNAAGLMAESHGMVGMSSNDGANSGRGVRIVGAVPKISRLHSH